MQFFWACTGLFSVFSALVLYMTLKEAKGAPQEAAGAAIALCVVIIPYVFTRAVEGWQQATWRKKILDELQMSRREFKAGVDSLRDPLNSVRSPGTSAPQVAAGMGYCPGCRKLRGLATPHCLYCKSTEPATPS